MFGAGNVGFGSYEKDQRKINAQTRPEAAGRPGANSKQGSVGGQQSPRPAPSQRPGGSRPSGAPLAAPRSPATAPGTSRNPVSPREHRTVVIKSHKYFSSMCPCSYIH
ncbi:hypothetical protein SARC_11528 [Sphaeroforma arctica JP610]|uniref:Uncharacterized protein n=1 Tax=Sphaeroforma arctica JP610 TaxID=667725 RepID=A0A0L0FHL2_9EUKA|nr:hypothetical protein SARC_11528 [Sphaeroforma arctica JP610]KNC75956.1 hypothetical protein SARC_11528 [Sphaeroforma arctica JP610]|eukprot:XP_014149858.1 hypothetical protein SARC_11528 [Sphaeroforma arctica JP610]